MNRRLFLASILCTGTAPAIVKAGSLMRVNPRIVVPPLTFQHSDLGFDFYTTPLAKPREVLQVSEDGQHWRTLPAPVGPSGGLVIPPEALGKQVRIMFTSYAS